MPLTTYYALMHSYSKLALSVWLDFMQLFGLIHSLFMSLFKSFLFLIAYPTGKTDQNSRSKMKCSYMSIQQGVVPQGGFSSDYVEHVGIVKNLNECVRDCCRSRDCDMAFMLANHCYRIRCSRDPKKCKPVQARGRNKFASKLVKLTRDIINNGE